MKNLLWIVIFWAGIYGGLAAQNMPRLGVAEFSTNLSNDRIQADAITARNLVESQMISTRKYQILIREELDKLLVNQRIQVSSIASSENIKKLQSQNISYIITGSVDALGNDYVITLKALDISTGQFFHSSNEFMGSGSRDLYTGITGLVAKFTAGLGSEVPLGQGGSPGTYKVGDRGPGGGFIFYAEAGMYMEISVMLGEYTWDQAIQAAKNYKGGGFTDWRLPSRGELDLIYQNLKRKNLAGLGNDWYWSSSQYGNNDAWAQFFGDGRQVFYDKQDTRSVRTVRAF